jgi:hypothetical protein
MSEVNQEEIVVPDTICGIAAMAEKDWRKQGKGVNYGARPYLDAMFALNTVKDSYGCDSGYSVVAYFLSNATSWKGPVAKACKAKLNKMLKGK